MLETSGSGLFSNYHRVIWRDSIKKRNVSLCCFQWNVARIVSQTIKRCRLALFPAFHFLPFENLSRPDRKYSHGFMSCFGIQKERISTVCWFRNAWINFIKLFCQILFPWGNSSSWIYFFLKPNGVLAWKLPGNIAFMSWEIKHQCEESQSNHVWQWITTQREFTEIILPRKIQLLDQDTDEKLVLHIHNS